MTKTTAGLALFATLIVLGACAPPEPTPCEAYGYCPETLVDPGTGPWTQVPAADVLETCGLEPAVLAAAEIPENAALAVVRHGRLCHVSGENGSDGAEVGHVWSATKTLGAVMTGMVMYETRDIPPSDARMMGPFTEWDRIDKWVDLEALPGSFDVNPDATVAHVLSMEAYNDSLAWGDKSHQYDAGGTREINSLITAIDNVVAQDPERLGADALAVRDRLFAKLGFESSSWEVTTLGYSWNTSVLDMARLGLVILNGGIYNGERLLSTDYVYDMTHPAFEDGSTRYGYLTWMNNQECTARAIHSSYPHGSSEATDCQDGNCAQDYDVGVWSAIGAQGQYIQGHRGLDMVIVARNWNADAMWEAVRAALVAADPTFGGDDAAFCAAYESNSYAPDLRKWEGNR